MTKDELIAMAQAAAREAFREVFDEREHRPMARRRRARTAPTRSKVINLAEARRALPPRAGA